MSEGQTPTLGPEPLSTSAADPEVPSAVNAETAAPAARYNTTFIQPSSSATRITTNEESSPHIAVTEPSQPSEYDDRHSATNDPAGSENSIRPGESPTDSNSLRNVQSTVSINQVSYQNGQTSSTPPIVSRSSSVAPSTTTPAYPDRSDLVPSTPRLSGRNKLGICAILLFSIGTAIILAGLGMLWFLWAADDSNNLWYQIMARNWLTKAVTITSEAIKLTVNFQIGSEVAMIASLALESFAVLFPHAASFSMMKACAGSGTVLILLKHQFTAVFRRRARATILISVLVVLLSIVYAVTQFFSVLLISDTGIGMVRGLSQTVNTTFGFGNDVIPGLVAEDSPWLRAPTLYPAFAEYSEPPFVADGVLDTGVCLRAFPPFRDVASRQTIQAYNGPITVIDARVTCQRPIFSRLSITSGLIGLIKLEGQASPSIMTPHMVALELNSTSTLHHTLPYTNGTSNFSCIAPVQYYPYLNWGLSICGLGSGAMTSEFNDFPQGTSIVNDPSNFNGTGNLGLGVLVLNVTLGGVDDWLLAFNASNGSLSPAFYSGRAEWLDLTFANNSLILSATLCYAPWGQTDIPVQISSTYNRTESVPSFDLDTFSYTYGFLREQYGQHNMTLSQRGVLQMYNQSWAATPQSDNSTGYVQAEVRSNISAIMGGPYYFDPSNFTTEPFVDMLFPVRNHLWLAQEILHTNGSVPFMLQSVITLLSSMTIFDYLESFNAIAPVEQTFFVQVTVPVSGRGMITVIMTLALHFVVAGVVLYFFLVRTGHSRLGGTWAALAQGSSGMATEYMERADLADDGDIEALMKKAGQRALRVGTRPVDGKIGMAVKQD